MDPTCTTSVSGIAAAHLPLSLLPRTAGPTPGEFDKIRRRCRSKTERSLALTRSPEFLVRAAWARCIALAKRQILVDHARARNYQKRGGGALRITADDIA